MESMSYENDAHHGSVLEEMKSMFDDRQLIDVVICVQDARIPAHRNVLAATSPYFKAMFTTNLTESRQRQILLHEVDPKSVSQIINYAYTGNLEITRGNAQNLLATASLFQILPVQKACAKFMELQLDVNNCVGIYYFAHIHSCEELRVKAREFIEKNFRDVYKTEEFLSLSHEKVSEIISSDELNVEKEEIVYEALILWIYHEIESRKEYLGDMLPLVRLGLLTVKYIQENIASNILVKQSKKCAELLDDLKDFEQCPETYDGEYNFGLCLRSGMIQPEHCILFIGGIDQSKPSINCYNPLTREAFLMETFPETDDRSGYYCVEDPAVCVTEDNINYAAGGNYIYHENYGETPSDDSFDDFDDEESVRKDFYQYDNDHNKWIAKAPMLFPKSNFSLVYLDGKIYSFGGLTVNQHPTEIVECYDIGKNRWNYVGMMPTTLVDLCAVTYRGEIFLLGGRTGVGAHNVVMKFDPRRFDWTSLAGMPTPRFNFGAHVVDDDIFVAGGQIYSHLTLTINREALKSVEIYNIPENKWRQGPDLPEEMYNVSLMQVNGALYACGTTEYQRSPFRIYRYNVVCRLDMYRNEWQQIESDLCDIRSYACVSAKLHTRKLSQVFRPEVDT
ncbi:kelch repeat and BTB domain-containing protein 8-like [Haliotis rufescens]|uniref:kelch repeat and BTB domain-containing protein 8-like n=1 Tax=Haliotis rufescens TaxID=6454 RepID=UPI00201EEABE|nr:kelch repeat and BTB domain-containing protein 8-like [Haliotis rufescens]XP_046371487.2 kelch repeat and BTB domain-containing protein 8-like [Haliotis rufescens]